MKLGKTMLISDNPMRSLLIALPRALEYHQVFGGVGATPSLSDIGTLQDDPRMINISHNGIYDL
jgi:hypothetical protein